MFSCFGDLENIRRYDIMEDKTANNFIGSKSLEYNLQFIPKKEHLFNGCLRESDREQILGGLDLVLQAEHLDKIWFMIWKRWEQYVQICSNK